MRYRKVSGKKDREDTMTLPGKSPGGSGNGTYDTCLRRRGTIGGKQEGEPRMARLNHQAITPTRALKQNLKDASLEYGGSFLADQRPDQRHQPTDTRPAKEDVYQQNRYLVTVVSRKSYESRKKIQYYAYGENEDADDAAEEPSEDMSHRISSSRLACSYLKWFEGLSQPAVNCGHRWRTPVVHSLCYNQIINRPGVDGFVSFVSAAAAGLNAVRAVAGYLHQ
jgi:hypothetical protein